MSNPNTEVGTQLEYVGKAPLDRKQKVATLAEATAKAYHGYFTFCEELDSHVVFKSDGNGGYTYTTFSAGEAGGGIALTNSTRTIFIDPAGNNANDNFVATGMRAIQLLGGNTVGATIVVLAGEYNWEITEENLPIAQYPNQLAGDGLTWIFNDGATVNATNTHLIDEVETSYALFRTGYFDGTIANWSYFQVLGLANIKALGCDIYDFNGYVGTIDRFVLEARNYTTDKHVIAPYKGDGSVRLANMQVFSFKCSGTIIGNLRFDYRWRCTQAFWSLWIIKPYNYSDENSELYISCENCPTNDFFFKDVSFVLFNAVRFRKCYVNFGYVRKIDADVQWGYLMYNPCEFYVLGMKSDIRIYYATNQSTEMIMGTPPTQAGQYRTTETVCSYNLTFQSNRPSTTPKLLIGHSHRGVKYNIVSDYELDIIQSQADYIDNSLQYKVDVEYKENINTLTIENCDVNIDTILPIGKIIARNTTVERTLNIKQPLNVSATEIDKSFIELSGQYKLNVENTLYLGASLTTPLEHPLYGIELFDDAQIIMNGGSIENKCSDENFLLVKNSKKLPFSNDILVKNLGGSINDDSISKENNPSQYSLSIDSLAPVAFDLYYDNKKYTIAESDIATYNTIDLLLQRLYDLTTAQMAIDEDAPVECSISTQFQHLSPYATAVCGFAVLNLQNMSYVNIMAEQAKVNVENYIKGNIIHTLSNQYIIAERRKEDGVYELTVLADRAGKLHINLEYYLFDNTVRYFQLLRKGNYSVKLLDFVDKQTSGGISYGNAYSTNEFNMFRDSETPLAYSNTCNEDGEMCLYRNPDGIGSVLYKYDTPVADIDLTNSILLFKVTPSYYDSQNEGVRVRKNLTVSGFINIK